ncbi:MAG: signal peptide peptidase SppA [candidate division WOR-3 bacterium]
MLFLILFSYISFPIATVERSRALYSNPAGLSIHSCPEISIRSDEFWTSISIPFLGFAGGIRFINDSLEFMTGVSPFHYKDKFSIGYMYSSWDNKYTLGFIGRPIKWVSTGLTTNFPSKSGYDFNFGISIMPGWDRLILSSDFFVDRGPEKTKYYLQNLTGSLEVLEGIKINFSLLPFNNNLRKGKIYGGLEFSFGNLLLGGSKGDKKSEGILTASLVPYPTLLKEKPHSIMIEIEGDYPEVPAPRNLLGEEHSFLNLLELLEYVSKTKNIDSVVVYIKPNSLGLAQVEEVRSQLLKIAKEKFLIAHSDFLYFKDLYLASAADFISLSPPGMVYFPGIYLSKLYIKGALEKLGIEAEVSEVGKYKSAGEMFKREKMSEYDREQLQKFLDDLIEVVTKEIAESRKIDQNKIKNLMDSLGAFTPQMAKKEGIIDTIAYFDEIKKFIGIKGDGKLWRGKRIPREFVTTDIPKIAVLALEGSIIVGKSSRSPIDFPIFENSTIGSETVSKELEGLRKDRSVKAVVIRINSGGGSSIASDLIYREILRLKEKKPVIISLGNIAASGGYYIAAPGTKILADKTTLTGSIGVWGAKFVTEGFYNKLGITRDVVKWGKHADALSDQRPFSYYEKKMFEKMLDHIYNKFIEVVSTSRNIPLEKVDSIGGGRIWSGLSAKEISLIDEYGGLLDAIKVAEKEAGVRNYKIILLPKPLKFFERLFGLEEISFLPIIKMIEEPYLYFEPTRINLGE